MIVTILIMIFAALLIYFSCELFVNGIEWVGKVFKISQSAVGSILAAFGTALPESIVTFIAVVFGANSSQKDIGVGAALGGPLVLSTLAYAIVGISIVIFSNRRKVGSCIKVNSEKLARNQVWFMAIFVFKIGLGLVAFSIKPWLGPLFLIAYGVYFYKEMNAEAVASEGELEPLKFSPKSINPKKALILLQTMISLIFIFIGSQVFVHNLDTLSVLFRIPPHIVSLLLSPIATELPETLNALIWVRQGKEDLAFGNISGSMMIQATVPSALGIMFTPWMLDNSLILSAVITFISILVIWITLKRRCLTAKRLSFNVVLYTVFIAGIIFIKGTM
ncbi:sodium:calcium antiporter [Clostridium sp. P21]|uniref:Sodium:calcium antiporter n=1 Tax=Clostridium muellerianum TaxID=2716538 RepID=A0A7Y0EFM6_9CLOT|nr:sodium:calcium antiporter [Clostridium muellerianum]NMM62542.1 sodium:calcium antiporter [Clostridium muellerianum]